MIYIKSSIENFSNRNKYKIIFDENLFGLYKVFLSYNFGNIKKYPQGIKDADLHEIICRDYGRFNPSTFDLKKKTFFITENYQDFLKFKDRNYIILGIPNNMDMEKSVSIISNFINTPSKDLESAIKNRFIFLNKSFYDKSVKSKNRFISSDINKLRTVLKKKSEKGLSI